MSELDQQPPSVRYVYWQDDDAWLGYIEEFPDYWTQGTSLVDLQEHLQDLYRELTSELSRTYGVWHNSSFNEAAGAHQAPHRYGMRVGAPRREARLVPEPGIQGLTAGP
jgi:hypothetical protein